MNPTQISILAGVFCYILLVLGIGYWASRRIRNDRDFITAGGQLGWLLSIGTIFATWFGAETCMGSSGTAFKKGILGVIADPFGAGLCLVISGLFFARYFRERNYQTIIDFFEHRYGRPCAAVLSVVYLPVYFGWVGAQLLAFGYILNSLTGFPLFASVLTATVVVLVYTYLGGMWADTMSDFFQMFIIIVGLLIIFPILVRDLGGWTNLRAQVPPHFFHFYPHGASWLDWLNYVQAWIIVGVGSLPAQDLFSRTMAPRTPTVSRWASITAGVLYVAVGLMPVLLGIFARVGLPDHPGEAILIDLALKYLPPILIAVVLGALLAAIMSSADSALLAPSSIIGHNILPSLNPRATAEQKLRWCRRSVPVLGVGSLILALYFKNIYALCQESWGVLLAGVAAPMIAGVYWKQANATGALVGAGAGVVCWLGVKIHLTGYPANLLGFAASLIVLIIVSLLTPPRRPAARGLT